MNNNYAGQAIQLKMNKNKFKNSMCKSNYAQKDLPTVLSDLMESINFD